jgi:hypothetical protein
MGAAVDEKDLHAIVRVTEYDYITWFGGMDGDPIPSSLAL